MQDQRLRRVFSSKAVKVAAAMALFGLAACAPSKGIPANLPLVKPPVKAATPAGLLTNATGASALTVTDAASAVSSWDLQDRFFSPGPLA